MSTATTELSTVNGWSNHETWLVNLWLTNESYLYDVLRHIIKAFDTVSEQAEELEHYIRSDDNCLEDEASMWSDLLGTALSRVNWYEIIENNR